MMRALVEDIGAFIKGAFAGAASLTAGGSGDDTAVTGATIDRQDYDSVSLLIGFTATLQATETLTLKTIEYQESDDGSSWDTAVSIDASEVVATGESGGSTETGVFKADLPLRGKKRYIRFNHTPDLSASGTDTAITAAVAVLGGDRVLPA